MNLKKTVNDVYLFCKAFLSNQLAKFFPKLYVNLTHQTGRGEEEGDPQEVANYFIECFRDYQKHLDLNNEDTTLFLQDKVVLEYGPGDILGVALLFYGYGAKMVCCVDKFPLAKMTNKNIEVYRYLLNSLGDKERKRAENAFNKKAAPETGFKDNCINYQVMNNGLSGEKNKFDLIISRAVLEHVNNLKETMLDIKKSMKNSGLSIHQVDLKSHGLDRYTDFDFLTWPTYIYKLMYSHKGFPNRLRVNKYRELAEESSLHINTLIPTGQLNQDKIKAIYFKIAKEFNHISPKELSWMGFWIHLEHKS